MLSTIDLSPALGPGSRPIELHSHDPLRYIGDMLAWLHQSLAGESEYLYAVCKLCPTPSIGQPRPLAHLPRTIY